MPLVGDRFGHPRREAAPLKLQSSSGQQRRDCRASRHGRTVSTHHQMASANNLPSKHNLQPVCCWARTLSESPLASPAMPAARRRSASSFTQSGTCTKTIIEPVKKVCPCA